jgi:hypothetical protein
MKSSAIQGKCQALNPAASLVMPKTDWTQNLLERFGNLKNFSDGKIFLGMSKINGQWFWDDGTPIFVRCNTFKQTF